NLFSRRTGLVEVDNGSDELYWNGTTLINLFRVLYELTTVFKAPRGVIPPTLFCVAEDDGMKSAIALQELLLGLKERNSKVSGAVALKQKHRYPRVYPPYSPSWDRQSPELFTRSITACLEE